MPFQLYKPHQCRIDIFGHKTPLVLQITTPSEPDNYALGVVLTVNHGFGPIVFHYQFHIHGAHCQSGAPA